MTTTIRNCIYCKQPVDDQPGFVCLGCQRDQAFLEGLVDDLWNDAIEQAKEIDDLEA